MTKTNAQRPSSACDDVVFCVGRQNVFVCGEDGIQQKRRALRSALDASPDFCFKCAAVLFKQHLVTIEMDEAYVNMPESLIQK